MKTPFPWFGGKARAAYLVWPRFGLGVPNYVEPFFGAGAVLLNRPLVEARVETINDKDAFVVNFWRAVQADPEAVAFYADWPVSEADLHARHRWLVKRRRALRRRLLTHPDYYNAKVAGWWVHGQCIWIGTGWCAADRDQNARNEYPPGQRKRPHIDRGIGRGVVSAAGRHANGTAATKIVDWNVRPDLSSAYGRGGVLQHSRRRPNLGGRGGGQGVCAPSLTRQIPQLSGARSGAARGLLAPRIQRIGLYDYISALAERLRGVRIICGDWRRVVTPAVTSYIGLTAIFCDPPYQHSRRSICYAHDEDVSADVRRWALEHGDDPKLRIALCGYQGEHDMPDSWECVPWKAGGGYSRTARGRANREAERIWFSPHCLKVVKPLFADLDERIEVPA